MCSVSARSADSTSPVSTSSKKLQPQWRPDSASKSCLCCHQQFSLWIRRHHCRACGELVCAACSPFTELLPEFGYDSPVRVCKDCISGGSIAASPASATVSEASSSDSENGDDEDDDELIMLAVEAIAAHSYHKHSKLSYEYFVQSEAVSWLVDDGVVKNRKGGVALFTRLIDEDYVTMKPWNGSKRTVFYYLSEDICMLGARLSQYGRTMHSETNKCNNCSQSFLELLTTAPGFCSIDCKTNALISQADSARIRRML